MMIPVRLWRGFLLVAGAALLTGCAQFWAEFYRPNIGPVGEKYRPILEAVWAQPEIGNGYLWHIYVKARDPNGDLDKVWVTFSQLGGNYPGTFLVLPANQRQTTNGAVRIWASLKGGGATGTIYGSAEVRVEDRAGNMSDSRSLEFAVVQYHKEDEGNPPPGFERGVLLGQLQGPLEFPLQTDQSLVGDDGDKGQ